MWAYLTSVGLYCSLFSFRSKDYLAVCRINELKSLPLTCVSCLISSCPVWIVLSLKDWTADSLSLPHPADGVAGLELYKRGAAPGNSSACDAFGSLAWLLPQRAMCTVATTIWPATRASPPPGPTAPRQHRRLLAAYTTTTITWGAIWGPQRRRNSAMTSWVTCPRVHMQGAMRAVAYSNCSTWGCQVSGVCGSSESCVGGVWLERRLGDRLLCVGFLCGFRQFM